MQCKNCAAEFTHLRKEHGCSSCSFSFCAKCLPKKIILPQLSRKPVSVCQNCYDRLTVSDSNEHKNKCFSSNDSAECALPATIITSEPLHLTNISETEDKTIEERLANLRSSESTNCRVVSVAEIEERLARLRGVNVEDVRSPSVFVTGRSGRSNEETVESLIEKAKAEASIERKWASQAYDDGDDFGRLLTVGDAESRSDDDFDMLMGDKTLGNLELQDTLAKIDAHPQNTELLLKQQAEMNKEMNSLLKLTKQNSLKAEKITEEIGRFWDSNLDHLPSDVEIVGEDVEVDAADLKEILSEAEKALNEEAEAVKASKKTKKGFLSKLFRFNN